MLTPIEKNGLAEILHGISDEDLFSLLETITKRMFTTRYRSEAIDKILSCTEKPSDLLHRQKITKKILFNYLVQRDNFVLADWAKHKLVKKCLQIWQSTETYKESHYNEVENENKPTEISPHLASQMGIEFTKWFFNIFNTLNGFGPEHFWPNCNLSAELYTPSDQKQVSVSGACDVATFLANLVMLDKYYFGANYSSDSVLVEMEQHGLVKIIIRGVLYQHSNCVGLFDSAFGLVRNPDCENTYKIQIMKVKMQVNCGLQGTLPTNNQLSICQTA